MRRLLVKRLPHLMRDYPGFKPWEIGEYTDDELAALLDEQNKRWKATRDADRKQKRRSPRR